MEEEPGREEEDKEEQEEEEREVLGACWLWTIQ